MQRGALILCIAVLVLIGTVAVSVAFADPAADGGPDPLEAPTSERALQEATAEATPVAMLEPEGPSPFSRAELEEIGRPEAEEVLTETFGAAVEGPAQVYDELEVEEFKSNHVAVVAPPDGSGEASSGLLSSVLPLRAEDDAGRNELIDLDLHRSDGSLEPENPLVPVEIPSQLSEGISFPG